MNYNEQTILLNDGRSIPVIGAGFWQVPAGEAERVCFSALNAGYKHIDTAVAYQNEREVGLGIKRAQKGREQFYLTSKIPAEVKDYDEALRTIDESIERLGVEYLDLMLIHAPKPWALMHLPLTPSFDKENAQVFKALIKAREEGKVKSIGVSNFNAKQIQNVIDATGVIPAVNQIRTHIGHVDEKTIAFCREKGIAVEGYSPLMTGKLKNNGIIAETAAKLGVTVAQLCIKYVLSLGIVALPKTTHEEYLKENLLVDFELTSEAADALKKVKTF